MSTVTEANPRLLAPTEATVSVWLDQIGRSLVESVEPARMIADDAGRAGQARGRGRIRGAGAHRADRSPAGGA
jgi:hypothetical protein